MNRSGAQCQTFPSLPAPKGYSAKKSILIRIQHSSENTNLFLHSVSGEWAARVISLSEILQVEFSVEGQLRQNHDAAFGYLLSCKEGFLLLSLQEDTTVELGLFLLSGKSDYPGFPSIEVLCLFKSTLG